MRKLFGTDGIRAVAGEAPLDARTIFAVGEALAHTLKQQHPIPRVLLGMDTRESGPWISRLLHAGLIAGGATLHNAGIITTPAIAYLARKFGFSAGVVISASHNPWQDNGIKIFGGNGYKLPDAQELAIEAEIFARLAAGSSMENAPDGRDLPPTDVVYRHDYEAFLRSVVPGLTLDGMHIVLDCANGAASAIAPELFATMGGTVSLTHADPSGRNINEQCGALHPAVVAREAHERQATLGITLDGDADRSLFSDGSGNVLNGDAVLLVAARALQAEGRLAGNVVVATTMSNMGLEAALARSGIRMLRAPVGDKYVLEMMQQHQAALGGEQSGHILFPHLATTGDGLLTSLVLLDTIQRSGKTIEALVADLKTFPQVIVNVRVREKKPLDGIQSVAAAIREAEEALAANGRVVIRYSGTEALARVMIEAESETLMRTHAEAIASAIRTELGV
ncbi:phosphoglucosamine mutase [Acidipila sp. EB88]|uniref:phosphoglucosamine mutase n=1 Tax=Acidipila sp. EB88 TaxID=2305226 RepID=UPI000F5E5176|nr:phosphoglucosamine mutase [Acidipila sp. EB88]RRA48737.1 phosphoglucosamine mutase [Acidipila sp. EB88]